ncbi:MAG: hypothetical protein Kow0069_08000 [Promethearchaeota archaeon]
MNVGRLVAASRATLVVDLSALVGAASFFAAGGASFHSAWNLVGALLSGAAAWQPAFVVLVDRSLDKNGPKGAALNRLGYLAAFWIALGAGLTFLGNFFASVSYGSDDASLAGPYALVIAGTVGALVAGAFHAAWVAKAEKGVFRPAKSSREVSVKSGTGTGTGKEAGKGAGARSKLRLLARIYCYSVLVVGIYFSFVTLAGRHDPVSGMFGIFVAQVDLFLVLTYLGAGALLLKLNAARFDRRGVTVVVAMTLVVAGVSALPVALVPGSVSRTEDQFSGAFGEDWKERVAPLERAGFFMPSPTHLASYFLGVRPPKVVVLRDVLFHEGSGEEQSLRLYFDAYLPPDGGAGLPGRNSTLVRIHGGGWVFGDKGAGNMMQVNKYFAAQGYCVFDVQYGLDDRGIPGDRLTPSHVLGDFDVDDMVRHLGLFFKYLSANAGRFGANLSSTFVSGGSAGGHLACAAALAIANGSYVDLFGDQVTVRGVVPFYPANGLAGWLGLEGDPYLVDPALLVDANSPPALVYQGTQDGLVDPAVSGALKKAYDDAGNPACVVYWAPLSGHAGDIYFSGYYNLGFLYLMERFLYLHR